MCASVHCICTSIHAPIHCITLVPERIKEGFKNNPRKSQDKPVNNREIFSLIGFHTIRKNDENNPKWAESGCACARTILMFYHQVSEEHVDQENASIPSKFITQVMHTGG